MGTSHIQTFPTPTPPTASCTQLVVCSRLRLRCRTSYSSPNLFPTSPPSSLLSLLASLPTPSQAGAPSLSSPPPTRPLLRSLLPPSLACSILPTSRSLTPCLSTT